MGADRPHILRNSAIIKLSQGATPLMLNPNEPAICVDACFMNSLEDAQLTSRVELTAQTWPVVFLAVYKLKHVAVHSNPVFCPNVSIIDSQDTCRRPGADVKKCSKFK